MDDASMFDRVALLNGALEYLPRPMKARAVALQDTVTDGAGRSLVIARARDILATAPRGLPSWVDTGTHYLVVLDAPEQTVPRLATILRLHKPDRRLHVSTDPGIVKRAVIALSRPAAWEGIIDAYILFDHLHVLLGDMTEREFPKKKLPYLKSATQDAFEKFTIDSAGAHLFWPELDLHMGPSQMLQAVDPTYLADVEIERHALGNVSQALYDMRNERDLRQADIEGLSERHVRRLESEKLRLSVDAAEKFAKAFGQDLAQFLNELSERVTQLRGAARPG